MNYLIRWSKPFFLSILVIAIFQTKRMPDETELDKVEKSPFDQKGVIKNKTSKKQRNKMKKNRRNCNTLLTAANSSCGLGVLVLTCAVSVLHHVSAKRPTIKGSLPPSPHFFITTTITLSLLFFSGRSWGGGDIIPIDLLLPLLSTGTYLTFVCSLTTLVCSLTTLVWSVCIRTSGTPTSLPVCQWVTVKSRMITLKRSGGGVGVFCLIISQTLNVLVMNKTWPRYSSFWTQTVHKSLVCTIQQNM